jgi:hypothetical protein
MSRPASALVCVLCFLLGFGLVLGCGGSSSAPVSGPSQKQAEKEKRAGK